VEDANARVEQTIKEIKEAEAASDATKEAREKLDEYKEDLADDREAAAEAAASTPEPEADEAEPPAESNGQPMGDPDAPIHEGDRVLVDDGSTEMEVQEVDGREAVVIMGSMHMRIDLDRLTKVGGPTREEDPQPTTTGDSTMAALKASPSIDVRGERVDEARQSVQHFLDDAIAAGLDTVEILHGKGTGALREALHDLLRQRSDISDYGKAPIEEGGAGVTKVTLA